MEELNKNNKKAEENKYSFLPIVIKIGKEYFQEKNNDVANEVVKYIKENKESKLSQLSTNFYLKKEIKGLDYYYSLTQDIDKNGDFYFSFDTKYGYAKTSLNKEQKDDLFHDMERFFNTVAKDQKENLKRIWMSFSEVNYKKEEVDECIDEILKVDKTKTKESLLDEGIVEIFKTYKDIYKKSFNYAKDSKLAYYRRMQIFEEYFENGFKNWNCEIYDDGGEKRLMLIKK